MTIYNKNRSTKKLTQSEVISKFIDVHKNRYDYSLVEYKSMKTPIKIICTKHGVFLQSPDGHKSGKGCPVCAQLSRNKNKSYSLKEILTKFKEVHGNRYDYSMVNYTGLQNNVTIICEEHGSFQKTPMRHMNLSHGCPYCPNEKIYKYYTIPNSEWLTRFTKVHGNKYDYSLVDINDSKVKIICPNHGVFTQAPKSHAKGHGCDRCARVTKNKSVSKIASAWLDELGVEIREFILDGEKRFYADGYDSKTNTIYEFYGDFWHGNPYKYKSFEINVVVKKTFGELYYNTIQRENFIKSQGFNLVTMWESAYIQSRSGRNLMNRGNLSE